MQLVSDSEPRKFAQLWESESTGEWVVREGTLVRAGRIRETGVSPDTAPLAEMAQPYLANGFREFDDDG